MSKNASTPVELMKTSESIGASPIILENSLRILDRASGFNSTAWTMNGFHPSFRTNIEVSSPWPTGRVIAMDFLAGVLDVDSSPALLDPLRALLDQLLSHLPRQHYTILGASRVFHEKFFLPINREDA